MSWKRTENLMQTIKHYASFPATGVSLRQMVQFGEKPSVGMLNATCLPTGRHQLTYHRNAIPSLTIPLRRTTNTAGPPGTRAERATRRPRRVPSNRKSSRLVCSIIRGDHRATTSQHPLRHQRTPHGTRKSGAQTPQ